MYRNLIDEEKLIFLFKELTAIDSVSFHEREFADRLKEKLEALEIKANEDKAYTFYNGNAGNVYGFVKGELPGAPILFSSHMDTVEPGIGKKPVIKEGRIVSEGNTVLGADDVGGISVILEAIRILKENKIPHRDIELLFPIAEETYVKGSRVFDYSLLNAKEAYVLDLTGKIGTASLREPTLISFNIEIKGKSSHAGFAPEKGINAIAIFAKAVSQLKLGKIDDDTTLNIGVVSGGTVTNAVPENVSTAGEIRSYVHEKAVTLLDNVKEIFDTVAKEFGGTVKFTYEINLTAYKVDENENVVKRFISACNELGFDVKLTETFGGSDNNSFLKNGIKGIVLASAMENAHTVNEYCDIEELKKSLNLVLKLMTSEM